jgi:TolA-binding protein
MLYRQKKYAEAEELINDANKASAGYDDWIARNLILLADVYSSQNDKNSAMAALEAVIENYTGSNKEIVPLAKQKYDALVENNKMKDNTSEKKGNKTLLELDESN